MIVTFRKIAFPVLTALALASWLAGFLSYVSKVESYRQPAIDEALQPVQAIVVLTGGSERVTAGLDLLKEGKGVKLLISGVHSSVKNPALLPLNNMPKELQECCLVLGHEAGNTRGNALETRDFMAQNHYDTMTLVTANYHMPRSMVLFAHVMPDKKISPFPVQPDIVNLDQWWRRPGTLSLLLYEYHKYLYAVLCITVGVY